MAMRSFRTWRISTQFMVFTFPIMMLMIGLATWMVHRHNVVRTHDKLVKRAQSITTQILADRTYYATVVVPRVGDIGGSIDADYKHVQGRFPLPATFVQEVSDMIATQKSSYQSRLISPWPINKAKGVQDEFQRVAFTAIARNPDDEFAQFGTWDGKAVFRYLVADRATAQSCLDCHNSHPGSPKHNFQLNDVMGGLEIILPAEQYIQEDRRDLLTIIGGGAVFCLALLGVILAGTRRTISEPLWQLANRMDTSFNKVSGGLAIRSMRSRGNELINFETYVKGMQSLILSQQRELHRRSAGLEVGNLLLKKQVEEQTRANIQNEERYRLVVDHANDAIIYTDPAGLIQWTNLKTELLLGKSESDMVGQSVGSLLGQESASNAQHWFAAVQQGVLRPSLAEYEFIHATGRSVWVEANIASVQEDGTVVGQVLVLRDITDRKRTPQ